MTKKELLQQVSRNFMGKSNCEYIAYPHEKLANNHLCVVGSSGSGKTTTYTLGNLFFGNSFSYVCVDAKGILYKTYAGALRALGYDVVNVDFDDFRRTRYNPFEYFYDEEDIIKFAHNIIYMEDSHHAEPFWNEASKMLLTAVMCYVFYTSKGGTMDDVYRLLHELTPPKTMSTYGFTEKKTIADTPLAKRFAHLNKIKPGNFASAKFNDFAICSAETTTSCIELITLSALDVFNTPKLKVILSSDNTDLTELLYKKTVMFVHVSDEHRINDKLANLFLGQVLQTVNRESKLKNITADIRFIFDDFATNVKIPDFQSIIASVRSRGVSITILLQAEAQLDLMYKDKQSILSNFDTYAYTGSMDFNACDSVAARFNLPVTNLYNMPRGYAWVKYKGTKPRRIETVEYGEMQKLIDSVRSLYTID